MHLRLARPPPSFSPRSSLDPAHYSSIDAVLKDLQACSRRLHAVLSTLGDELRILERLYYKGKNQHRAALFWKRVVEIRRYGQRLSEVNIPDLVIRLRSLFFGEKGEQMNTKSMKGAWTSVPNTELVLFALHRIQGCSALVEKMQGRLLEAYRSFKLALQTGAFIQLVLTLSAMASRMHFLMPELQEVLALGWTAFHRTLLILDPTQGQRVKFNRTVGADSGLLATATTTTATTPDQFPHKAQLNDPSAEDTGLRIIRQTPAQPDPGPAEILLNDPSLDAHPTKTDITGSEDTLSSVAIIEQIKGQSVSSIILRQDVGDDTLHPGTSRTTKSKGENNHGDLDSKKKTKRRKKRDEIDDIFGV